MARLIDADALQRRICGAKCGCEYEDCGCEGDCIFDHFISHAPTVERWIPVSERLPEHEEVVLVCGSRGGIYTAYCNRKYKNPGWHKLNSKNHYCEPTHWMPLPEAPKEG